MTASAAANGASVDVTVGIPTYNRPRLLERSIASVPRQSYRRFTLVVSASASDDDTAGVVASFRDPRLVYRPLQRNIGRAANINRLIQLAETEFMVLLGDDDQLSARPTLPYGRRAQAVADRWGGAHRMRDRRHLRQHAGLPPSPNRYPAPGRVRIRSAVPRAQHEVGLDGVLPFGHLPQGGPGRRGGLPEDGIIDAFRS